MDEIGCRAAMVIERVLSSGPLATTAIVAQEVARALQDEGLLGRCSCSRAWGQVRDPECAVHGRRDPAHTVVGA